MVVRDGQYLEHQKPHTLPNKFLSIGLPATRSTPQTPFSPRAQHLRTVHFSTEKSKEFLLYVENLLNNLKMPYVKAVKVNGFEVISCKILAHSHLEEHLSAPLTRQDYLSPTNTPGSPHWSILSQDHLTWPLLWLYKSYPVVHTFVSFMDGYHLENFRGQTHSSTDPHFRKFRGQTHSSTDPHIWKCKTDKGTSDIEETYLVKKSEPQTMTNEAPILFWPQTKVQKKLASYVR